MEEFGKDVLEGLTAKPKYLSSKYIYDAEGDKIFQRIMNMPEYYLTNCEFEILETYKDELMHHFSGNEDSFELVELGAGDGLKTKILLQHFLKKNVRFSYVPIDISHNILTKLEADILDRWPEMNVEVLHGEYFSALESLQEDKEVNKVILLLGSNIGNFPKKEALTFLNDIRNRMNDEDQLLIGFDLKKDPDVILQAYSDPHGNSEAFSKNVLGRINRELGGEFDLGKFKHFQHYHPVEGNCESFLISSEKQEVRIEALSVTIHFDKSEPIHVEISQKYDFTGIKALLSAAGLKIKQSFQDERGYFSDVLCEKNV
jgi:dimethylhistidine N-methyltransferase